MPNPGDILLKKTQGTLVHGLISFGQAVSRGDLFGRSSGMVHAAMYAGAGNVFESIGSGLGYGPATAGASWTVFRYRDRNMASIALDIAHTYWHIQQSGTIAGYGDYSAVGAVGSLFGDKDFSSDAARKAEELWTPHADRTFFCSNYVIRCFQAAGQTYAPPRHPIQAEMDLSPAELFARLGSSPDWTSHGTVSF